MLDATDDAKQIMKAVRDLNNQARNCNLTLVLLTDIFKGSDIKKIRELGIKIKFQYIILSLSIILNFYIGLNKSPLYGRGKSWNRADIDRLLHHMVLKEYLQEQMYINNEIACAYVKIGPNAAEFMTKKDIKVE